MNQKQKETINGITPKGLMLHSGTPCECGSEYYSTKTQRKYSDTMLYKHKCKKCRNKFETWTEG